MSTCHPLFKFFIKVLWKLLPKSKLYEQILAICRKKPSSTLKKPVHKELHNMHKYEVKAVTYLSTRETSKVFKI